jgi:hypothetical protein
MGVHPDDNKKLTPDMVETLMRHERTRQIICKLYKHFDDITKTDKLTLVFHCAGCTVRLIPTLHYDN